MHTMYYSHEIRKMEEFRTDTSLVKEKEVELARMLVESLAAEFEPDKYRDAYRDNLQTLIDAKIKGQEVVAPPDARACQGDRHHGSAKAEPGNREETGGVSDGDETRGCRAACRESPRAQESHGFLSQHGGADGLCRLRD